jgi:hypothetical protein
MGISDGSPSMKLTEQGYLRGPKATVSQVIGQPAGRQPPYRIAEDAQLEEAEGSAAAAAPYTYSTIVSRTRVMPREVSNGGGLGGGRATRQRGHRRSKRWGSDRR